LNRHITNTYRFDTFHIGWVQVWASQQTLGSTDWYQGTADAVRKQLFEIRATHAQYVLILSGDHLYRMDYSKMAEFHSNNHADITIAVHPVSRKEVNRFGILKSDENHHIIRFAEKPKDQKVIADLVCSDNPKSLSSPRWASTCSMLNSCAHFWKKSLSMILAVMSSPMPFKTATFMAMISMTTGWISGRSAHSMIPTSR